MLYSQKAGKDLRPYTSGPLYTFGAMFDIKRVPLLLFHDRCIYSLYNNRSLLLLHFANSMRNTCTMYE